MPLLARKIWQYRVYEHDHRGTTSEDPTEDQVHPLGTGLMAGAWELLAQDHGDLV